MEEYTVYHNDEGYILNFTVTDYAGNARNLTGLTVTLKAWLPGWPGSLKINGACVIDDAAGGLCHYTLAAGDCDMLGTFMAELEGTAVDYRDTLGQYKIIVKESG